MLVILYKIILKRGIIDVDTWSFVSLYLCGMGKFIRRIIREFAPLLLMVVVCVAYYFYTPHSAIALHNRIEATRAGFADATRLELSKELGEYLSFGLPHDPDKTPTLWHLFWANQRKFFDISLKQAIAEIGNTDVGIGKMRVWSFMNMGAVVKTNNKIIAFDTADMPESLVQSKLASVADIFLVTHSDMDHFDPSLLRKALQQGKLVVLPENLILTDDDNNLSNVRYLKDGESIEIDEVKITAFQTDHRGDGNFITPNAWYLVEIDGFKILHTGDGRDFKNPNERKALEKSGVDVFLCNVKLAAFDVRDIGPKVVVPMHLFKFMHSRDELANSTIDYAVSVYGQYIEALKGIRIMWLFPGESFQYPL